MRESIEVQKVTIHGHQRAFVKTGSGPALLLLHGLGCDHTTWLPVIAQLAKKYTVIAPDLLGHGASDKPRADYSVGGYANGMRDLLTVLNIDKVTVVGHSLGGGVAMQFGYQFPERTERIILVAPGGLGPEVTPLIRAVSLPGFNPVMGVLTLPVLRHAGMAGLRALARTGMTVTHDLDEVAGIYDSFKDRRARRAISHVVRAVVDTRGQLVTMVDRAYLTQAMPMLIIWGSEDRVIPVKHARTAA
ncbi:MAG TPA: alpha/beta fold hydrolase, partial [Marmoricola sp.]|nr:alpha/beta fold hydrolase [Marmoricola sp.]